MAKYSDNNISSLSDDWAYDKSNGLPYSGRSVQKFIKDNLGEISRACFFDTTDATLRWFASEEDRDSYRDNPEDKTKVLYSVPITFTSDLFRIELTNHNNTTSINIATNQEELVLSLGFQVQQKSVTETVWHSTERSVKVVAYMDSGATGNYIPIHEPQIYGPGQDYEIDVRSYLSAGANRVRIQFIDEEDNTVSATITYSINLTNLFIELMNNTWYLPIVEGGDEANYKLGGFKIVGSLNKVVHFDIYSGASDVKLREFTYNLYNTSFDVKPFDYNRALGFNLGHQDGKPDLTTGVYLVSAYLTSGSGDSMLITDAINYNIMYITAADVTSAQLVCMNNVSDRVYNYTESDMFHYAIYNKNINVGSPHIIVSTITGTNPTEIDNKTLQDIETGVEQVYSVSLNWLTEETINLYVTASMSFGNEQVARVTVDNSKTYPPTRGFDLFLNAATRDNSNINHVKLINEVNKQELTPDWSRMVWVDGVDGWMIDDIGRRSLYIRAGSSMTLPFSERALMGGDNITLELCYKISNVADYDEPVISIADDKDAVGFRGIRIKPTNITVHSSEDAQEPNDYLRSVNVADESVIHFVLTINKGAGGPNFNLVTGYINGCKNFQFSYTNTAQWLVQGPLIIGGDKSDISLYYVRTYPFVLSSAQVQDNYINSLEFNSRSAMKEFMMAATESDGSTISYESVKNNRQNFFVIEMLNGQPYPSAANGWTRKTEGLSNIEMHFGEHPDWDWKVYGAYTTGQGTTSMGYYRWNIRWKIDDKSIGKKAPVSYLSSRSLIGNKYVYEWADSNVVKDFNFDGSNRHPKTRRITAKINFASSMQSHKMGATYAYNELHNLIDRATEQDSSVGLLNQAQIFAKTNELPMPSVSVYQYPAYGFVKNSEDSYSFIGLFTIGPDKGDKPTFGFNIDDSISDTLITLEGTDHDREVVMFSYPWDQNMLFKTSDECLNATTGEDRGGWEVGNCYTYDTGVETDAADINSILQQEFKPAYDCAFNNSTMIFGIDRSEYNNATPAEIIEIINADPAAFGGLRREGNRFPNSSYQFWIDGEYILYYRSLSNPRVYVQGINLVQTLGTPEGNTVEEKNAWFKARRCQEFRSVAESYWDIQDTLFHYAFIMCIGAVDNFGKNTYPYKMAPLAEGGRWKWLQDDLDSILGINNAGYDNVPTWSEYEDGTYYGGSASIFWTLIKDAYTEDYVSTVTGLTKSGILSMGGKILNKMNSLVGGTNIVLGVIEYFRTRFWNKAQKYFPASAYNTDATFKYENAWVAGADSQAEPLPQSLGDHYSAEYRWVYNRVMYLLSMFRAGPFGEPQNSSLGLIGFRPDNLQRITVTPFYKMYPAISNGQIVENGPRMNPGEEYTFVGPYSPLAQTQMSINAAHMLSSIGDLKDLVLSTTLTPTLGVTGRKLATFKIGDENPYTTTIVTPAVYYTQEEINSAEEGDDAYGKTTSDIKTPAVYESNIKTNVQYLTFTDVPCLEEIDARNASSIIGSVDLSACKRLRKVYLDGTNISGLVFANGQPIEYASLPDTISTISMKNMKFLTPETMIFPSNLSGISLLQIENCGFNAMDLLSDAYNSDNSALTNISITLPTTLDIDYALLSILSGLATNKDKDGNLHYYHGVNADGSPADTGTPNIIGTVQLTTPFYMETFEALGMNPDNERDYGEEGLKINGIANLGALQLIYDPTNVYIPFIDTAVLPVLVANDKSTDETGITYSTAASTTSLGTIFRNNTSLESFDELQYFGITSLASSAFSGCTALRNIHLPATVTSLGTYSFDGCTALEEITFEGNFTPANYDFRSCSSLTRINIPSVDMWLNQKFHASNVYVQYPFNASSGGYLYVNNEMVEDLNNISSTRTRINSYCFYNCKCLKTVSLPNTITVLEDGAFNNCTNITTMNIPSNVTSIGDNCFTRCIKWEGTAVVPNGCSVGSGAFSGCRSLTNLVIPVRVSTTTLQGSGNGTGLLCVDSFTGSTTNTHDLFYKDIILTGNVSFSSPYGARIFDYVETIRCRGNVALQSSHLFFSTNTHRGKVKFLEVMGTVTNSSGSGCVLDGYSPTTGYIVHLGYMEGVACVPSRVRADAATTIYVGNGEDKSADEALLNTYSTDTDYGWSEYSAKLDTWWNYVNVEHGEYAVPPTIPSINNE